MLTRRHVFFTGAAGLAALVLGRLTWPHAAKAAKTYEVTHTDAEWQKMLSPDAVPGAAPRRHRAPVLQPAQQ